MIVKLLRLIRSLKLSSPYVELIELFLINSKSLLLYFITPKKLLVTIISSRAQDILKFIMK